MTLRHVRLWTCVVFLAFVQTGCSVLPAKPPATAPAATPAGLSAGPDSEAAAAGKVVLRIDAAASLVEIEVRRAGALAALGHDHLIAARGIEGFVLPEDGRADLLVRLDQLSVDEADLRASAGFTTQPSADAIAGTRRNMFDKVLETGRFPNAQLAIARLSADQLEVTITLKGVTRSQPIPAVITQSGQSMTVSGRLSLLQSDFGITPFSVMGGALSVQDRVEMRFRIHARP